MTCHPNLITSTILLCVALFWGTGCNQKTQANPTPEEILQQRIASEKKLDKEFRDGIEQKNKERFRHFTAHIANAERHLNDGQIDRAHNEIKLASEFAPMYGPYNIDRMGSVSATNSDFDRLFAIKYKRHFQQCLENKDCSTWLSLAKANDAEFRRFCQAPSAREIEADRATHLSLLYIRRGAETMTYSEIASVSALKVASVLDEFLGTPISPLLQSSSTTVAVAKTLFQKVHLYKKRDEAPSKPRSE